MPIKSSLLVDTNIAVCIMTLQLHILAHNKILIVYYLAMLAVISTKSCEHVVALALGIYVQEKKISCSFHLHNCIHCAYYSSVSNSYVVTILYSV